MFKNEKCLAISGPSHQEQPMFSFKSDSANKDFGLPKVWNFNWVEIGPEFIKNSG